MIIIIHTQLICLAWLLSASAFQGQVSLGPKGPAQDSGQKQHTVELVS